MVWVTVMVWVSVTVRIWVMVRGLYTPAFGAGPGGLGLEVRAWVRAWVRVRVKGLGFALRG